MPKIGYKHSEESRKKMSLAHLGQSRPHTEETKRKIGLANSVSLRGNIPWNKNLKGVMVAWNKNLKLSAEHRKRLSESHMGQIPGNKGKKASEEVKRKMSLAKIGKPTWVSTHKEEFSKMMSGENHPLWIKDRSIVLGSIKERASFACRYWSRSVKNRDGWKCKISDKNCCEKVVAHHILSWRDHPELRYELNNGITLCKFHHPRKRIDEAVMSPYFQELVGIKL